MKNFYLPPPPATSGLALLYALPYRSLEYEKRQTVAAETACPDIARADIAGFTLIELAIVLVIIGLLVGGILAGQELISKAAVRAQISQVEKFNAAVNTFRDKYSQLPGDITPTAAAQFGFIPRGQYSSYGDGDGNGLIQGYSFYYHSTWVGCQTGEPYFFWEDLSKAGLIEGTFNFAQDGQDVTVTNFSLYVPPSKINPNDYVYVYSVNGLNYFAIGGSYFTTLSDGIWATSNITVSQAALIDSKIDDGLPTTGHIITQAPWGNGGLIWSGAFPGTAANGSSTTCYDNGGNASNPMGYSLKQNGGNGQNCALSFQFQ